MTGNEIGTLWRVVSESPAHTLFLMIEKIKLCGVDMCFDAQRFLTKFCKNLTFGSNVLIWEDTDTNSVAFSCQEGCMLKRGVCPVILTEVGIFTSVHPRSFVGVMRPSVYWAKCTF